MTNALTIALAQINVTVGDIRGNSRRIIDVVEEASRQGADLVLFPEMAITGYPAEDLLFKEVFQQAAMQAVQDIASGLADCPAAALVGGYWVEDGIRRNSAFLIEGGAIIHRHDKHWLPNYGVFDEKRLFTKGPYPEPVVWRGTKLGVLVCEDLWKPGVPEALAFSGAELLLVLNASPFETGKVQRRLEVVRGAAREANLPVVYCNLIGGQDELVFDGRSFVMDRKGEVVAQAQGFAEDVMLVTYQPTPLLISPLRGEKRAKRVEGGDHNLAEIYSAMVLGLRDYVQKNGFKGVVIGLSGGIDSGLTAAVAVDALGAEQVHGLIMPSPYTSAESIEDAQMLANNLGIETHTIAIEQGMQAFETMLAEVFYGTQPDTTEENIQSRIRGNLLMAYSNKRGMMVLTTGNKSEMSVGYATLYGDMCGGYSVLKDVYKTTVFALARWRNEIVFADAALRFTQPCAAGGVLAGEEENSHEPAKAARPFDRSQQRAANCRKNIIPQRMIDKPPSAELKPDQRDDDTLPPYDVLDGILHGLIEERRSIAELVTDGYDVAVVEQVARMIYIAEYKRRQSPPGVKITGMSFGRDRRYPITNRWIWQRS